MRRTWLGPAMLAAAVAAVVTVARVDRVRRAVAQGPPGGEVRLAQVLPDVRFEANSLDEAVAALGRASGARIVVNARALDAAGVDRSAGVELKARGLTLAQALRRVFTAYDRGTAPLDYAVDGDAVVVSTAADLGRYAVVRVYDVRDLLPPDGVSADSRPPVGQPISIGLFGRRPPLSLRQEYFNDLTDLVRQTVAPDSWVEAGGSVGSVREVGGRLVVVQTRQNQDQVEHLFNELRVTDDAGRRAARVPAPEFVMQSWP